MFTDNPEDLKEHRIDFIVEIHKAEGLPPDFCTDVHVEYQFYLEEGENKTQTVKGKNPDPVFDYRKQHTVGYVTDNFLEYLADKEVSIGFRFIFYSFNLKFTEFSTWLSAKRNG